MRKKVVALFVAVAALSMSAEAQNKIILATSNPGLDARSPLKPSVKLRARALFDLTWADTDESDEYDDVDNLGAYVPDMRLGASGRYGQWSGKVEAGLEANKVSMKDVFLSYSFNKANYVTFGYFIPKLGINGSTSSTSKPTFQDPLSTHMFGDRRSPNIGFIHEKGAFYFSGTAHTENKAMTAGLDALKSMSWGLMGTFDWRPAREKANFFQIGIAFDWSRPTYHADEKLNHSSFSFSDSFPFSTTNLSVFNLVVADAKNKVRFAPEIQMGKGKWAFEGQYYFQFIGRNERKYEALLKPQGKKLGTYYTSGFYASLRYMMLGTGFEFDEGASGIATPGNGEMELVLGYNYTNMSDHNSFNMIRENTYLEPILGGKFHDLSLTWNYYINPHVMWRIRASWSKVTDRGDCTPIGQVVSDEGHFPRGMAFWGFQTRLQFKF